MSKLAILSSKAALGAVGLGVLGVSGVLASAASLGTVSNASLGSAVQVVASCDTDGMTATYTNAFDATTGNYKVSSITLAGLNAVASPGCSGKTVNITLKSTASGAATAQGTATGTVTLGTATATQTFTVTGNTDAALVLGAAVVIAD